MEKSAAEVRPRRPLRRRGAKGSELAGFGLGVCFSRRSRGEESRLLGVRGEALEGADEEPGDLSGFLTRSLAAA